jgi:hypothetical protein
LPIFICFNFSVCQNIPSIPTIQQLIEDAWRHGKTIIFKTSSPDSNQGTSSVKNTIVLGFDQQGAAQLDHKLTKTKKWIGATEIAVALKFIGLRYASGSFCSKRSFPQFPLLQWTIPQLTKILNSTSLDKNFITA